MVALRQLAGSCDFGQFLEEALRDRLVCGLKEEYIQKHLLSQKDLTLSRAVELAQGLEQAAEQASTFHSAEKAEVHKIQGKNPRPGSKRGWEQHQKKGSSSTNSKVKCFRCGMKGHDPNDCHFKDATCYKCEKKGHTSRVCTNRGKIHQVKEQEDDWDDPEEGYLLKMDGEKKEQEKPYMVWVKMDGKEMSMEVDTGASHTVMTEEMFKESFPAKSLTKTSLTLRTYSGEEVNVLGMFTTEAQTNQQTKSLPVIVVRGGTLPKHPLLGRNWLDKIKLDWKSICGQGTLNWVGSVDDLKKKYPGVFDMTTSEPMKSFKATLRVPESAKPIVKKARPVPFAKRQAVEDELREMVETGKAEKVEHSRWASPVVAIEKADGRVRLCGDYKVTVNTVIEPDPYPLPTAEDLFGQLAGGRCFAKLDLKEAYLQLEVEEGSREFLTLNTHPEWSTTSADTAIPPKQ